MKPMANPKINAPIIPSAYTRFENAQARAK